MAIKQPPDKSHFILPDLGEGVHEAELIKWRVKPGDRVERGDEIAAADGWVSSPVHASAAGEVTAIELWPHSTGTHQPAIRLAV